MLSRSLLAEIYDEELTQDELDKMLTIPSTESNYDPYKPLKTSPINFVGANEVKRFTPPSPSPSSSTSTFGSFSSCASTSNLAVRDFMSHFKSLQSFADALDDLNSLSSTPSPIKMLDEDDEEESGWQDLIIATAPSSGRYSRRYPSNTPHYCSFCFHNGDSEEVYTNHDLRDAANNVICPALFEVVCRHCGATGSQAHTPKYCPLNIHASLLDGKRRKL